MDKYEIEYTKNQCFIPKAIWPKLETKFMQARGNPFEQQASLDFIEFTLGLTVFKPLKGIDKKIDLKKARQLLSAKIDQFFENYEELDAKQRNHLKKMLSVSWVNY